LTEADDGGLVGRETRRRLVDWWEQEYCANRMRLCVIGKESLKELEELIAVNFSPIPNRNKDPLPLITGHPFGPEEKGTLVSVDTIMRFHAIEISFPLPYQAPHWRHKPADLVSHFVGHEGPGSLHAYLKNKGWITGLSSGPQNLGRGIAMFKITVHVTNDGFSKYASLYQPLLAA
jgi:insulysin